MGDLYIVPSLQAKGHDQVDPEAVAIFSPDHVVCKRLAQHREDSIEKYEDKLAAADSKMLESGWTGLSVRFNFGKEQEHCDVAIPYYNPPITKHMFPWVKRNRLQNRSPELCLGYQWGLFDFLYFRVL